MARKNKKNILPKEAMIFDLRKAALAKKFKRSVGQSVFIVLASPPYTVIGKIEGVHLDRICVQIDKTTFSDIDGKKMYIHLDNIKVFNIEKVSKSSISIGGNIESYEE